MPNTENQNTTPEGQLESFALTTGGAIDIDMIKQLCDKAGSSITIVDNIAKATGIPASVPLFIDRMSGKPTSLKALFEEWRTGPERKRGQATVNTLESFTGLVNRHKTGDSVIFADTNWKAPSLTAVIDYHPDESGGGASYAQHRVHYPFPLTEEWQAWVSNDGKGMDQAKFAEFIEDHRAELTAPHEDEVTYWQEMLGGKMAAPNELQMLSRGLKINAETKASSAVTLATGEGEISWEETHSARNNQGGKIIVPSLFMLQVAPFYQGEKARLPVRLRYRLPPGGGAIVWFYQLYRPDTYITEQVIRDLDRAAAETSLSAYQGKPEAVSYS